jgi:peptidylprolyl isomerase
MFDSSIPSGEPVTFPLNRVIPGWTDGLQLMQVGETRRFWLPAKLAYGYVLARSTGMSAVRANSSSWLARLLLRENPPRGAPAGMLVFDVELLGIN